MGKVNFNIVFCSASLLGMLVVISGCVSGPVYRERTEYRDEEVIFDPPGAILVATLPGATASIISNDIARVTQLIDEDRRLARLRKCDSSLPDGLVAQWPTGVQVPIVISTGPYISVWLKAEHPYKYARFTANSNKYRLFEYDRWQGTAQNPISEQVVIFNTDPPAGYISIDGGSFVKCPVTNSWEFSMGEFLSNSKMVDVRAGWRSGAVAVLTNINIAPDGIRTPYSISDDKPEAIRVTVSHPDPKSLQHEYDEWFSHSSIWRSDAWWSPPMMDVLIDSSPAGAEIFREGKLLGIAPQRIREGIAYTNYEMGYAEIGISARWPSQAEESKTLKVPITHRKEKQDRVEFIIERPKHLPNIEIDQAKGREAEWAAKYATNPPTRQIYITSDPEGATIYRDNEHIGIAPANINVSITREMFLKQDAKLVNITARWVSGATNERQFSVSCDSERQSHTFIRNPETPNLELDVNYAIGFRQVAEQKRAAATQETIQFYQVQAARQAQEQQELEATRSRLDAQRQANEKQRIETQRIDLERNRLQMEQEAASKRQRIAEDQSLFQERALAEQQRANQVREQQERNAQTLKGMQMLTDQLNKQYPAPAPTPASSGSYEVRPKFPSIDQDPMAPGSYMNPYIIEQK